MKRCFAAFGAVLLLALSVAGCEGVRAEPESVSKTNLMLDTIIQITLYDWQDEGTIDLAFDEIRRLEGLLSVEQEGSELFQLAQAAGTAWVEISPETEEVLRLSKEYAALSQGYFDVTIGPLVDLWNIHDGQGHYPSQEELAQVLPLIGSDDLLVEEGRAYLARPGMEANLGAIAKGYIADRVKDFLVGRGVEHAVLNLGRNILLIGDKGNDTPFTVGIQDPGGKEGELAGVVAAADKSVVTSGIDERNFVYEGKTYHHVLDPFTGFPADNGLASVTILSDNSAQGDALSTACLLMGQEKGMALVEQLEGVEALFIATDGTQTPSSGYEDYAISHTN
ncbi:MAG: FAD:protein FMN transferase [Clostridiales bacterium]|nr:FAD:protein FMN transferase [Clostridiales bacterium]